MASLTLALDFDHTPMTDALDSLNRLEAALGQRHGPEYRALQDELLALLAGPPLVPPLIDLGEGQFMIAPPMAVTLILRDGVRLGCI